MSVDKKIDYVEQDGSLNFIKNSESVTVPKRFKARKEAPAVKLAYITDAEAKMLKKKKPGTPHKGPKGIPSYDTFGSIDSSGRDTGVSGAAASAAETGSRNPRDVREMQAQFNTANLGPGVIPKQAQDLRNAFIVAGGGQRVNPRFFDSRNTISPQELALARASNPRAFDRIRGGGIMGLLTGGGFLGNIIRGIGQRLGFGKRFNQPTYDLSEFSAYGLGGSKNPAYDDFTNEDLLSLITTKDDEDKKENVRSGIETIDVGFEDPAFENALMAGLTEKQKQLLDQRRGMLDALGDQGILDTIKSEDDPNDPATLQDVRQYYGLA